MQLRRIALGLLLLAAACDESPVSLPEPAGVAVAGTAMTLAVGDAAPVAAQVVDQNGQVMQGLTPVFSTDNPSIATVGTDGVVRAVAPGTANVTAKYGASAATVRVTVTAANLRVAVPASTMALVVGDATPLAAQVLDPSGRVVQGAVLAFSTDNPGVAAVGMDGMVRGVTPGTATITAAYGSSTAAVRVTVLPNRRNELQSLEVMADSVVADRRAGVQVVAVRATNGFGQAVCPQLTLRSSDPSVATARMAGVCRIEVTPLFAGETTITVEAEGRTDTFLVRVTSSGQIAFFSARPTSEQLVAGATVSYTVKVLDQNNQPVANQRVNFEATVGTLSATSATTGEDGTATVQWQIPTHLRDWGQNHVISFRAPLSNGRIAFRDETVFINGASLAQIDLYRLIGTTFTRIPDGASVTAPAYSYFYLGAAGVDQYGNVRIADFTFSLTGSYWFWDCGGSAGTRHVSGIEYTCFYSQPGTTTATVTTPGAPSKSVQVVFGG